MDGGFKPGAGEGQPGLVTVLNTDDFESGNGSFQIKGGYFQAPDLIFDLKLSANEKLVLIYLMRRADRQGMSFPSVARICRDCGIKSESTVRKVIKGLEKEGLVRVERKPSKSNRFYVAGWLYEVIERAKDRHIAKKKNPAGTVLHDCTDCHMETDTPQNLHPDPSEFDPSTPQILTPKEYTVEPDTEKEYTVNKEARKKKKRALEEAHASSFSVKDDFLKGEKASGGAGVAEKETAGDNSDITMLEAQGYYHGLTPGEQKKFDREARKLIRPGEPEPEGNLWQKRLLRVRYLKQLKDGGGDT